MSLNNRYTPSHPQGDNQMYALDFSNLLPPGVGIATGSLAIEYNTVPPTPQSDWTLGPPSVVGRRVYCQCEGGLAAKDYRLTWTVVDSLANQWSRACLLLCAA